MLSDTTKDAYTNLSIKASEISEEILQISNWIVNGETKKAQEAIYKMEVLGAHLQNAAKITKFML